MQDLFAFQKRKANPLNISAAEIQGLLKIIPFWLFRFLGFQAYGFSPQSVRFIADQLSARYYFINESGGIAHLSPDYETLVKLGTDGIIAGVEDLQAKIDPGHRAWSFYEAVKIIARNLAGFGRRYADLALRLARDENDPVRRTELFDIATACRRVPQKGAGSFREALQSILLAQIARGDEDEDVRKVAEEKLTK